VCDAEVGDQAPQHRTVDIHVEQVDHAPHVIDEVAIGREGQHREGLLEASVEVFHLGLLASCRPKTGRMSAIVAMAHL